jgi:DNA polymerase I-like protein with 3'-5' exonuclease and polymerase domains
MNINPDSTEAYNLLHDGSLALTRAEQQGIRIDMTYAEKQKTFLTRKIERLENNFRETPFYQGWQQSAKGEVNINSNSQLSNYLYKVKHIRPPRETPTGQGATDKDSLQQMNIPEINDLLYIRKLKKIRDTYLDGFMREQIDGYIHPSFNLHLVRTFRSSASDPNVQNIPKRDDEAMTICRKALFPRPGHQLLEIDYSGLEVRIAACYHKDPTMLRYINNPASDMHRDMAEIIFKIKFDKTVEGHSILRSATKNGFVFPEFYGDYYKNCAESLACGWGKLPHGRWSAGEGIVLGDTNLAEHMISKGFTSLNKFTDHVRRIEDDFWMNRFKVYATWKERWYNAYKRRGYIDMLTGFRCSGVMSRNDCINYPIQGAAFHCLLWSFVELDRIMREAKWDTRLVGQIHDSILMDVNPTELSYVTEIARKITCEALPKNWSWIIVPLDVEMELSPVDKSWADKEILI